MKSILTLCILFLINGFSIATYSQKVTPWAINDVPPNEVNDRFFNGVILGINRPALSIVGFDTGGDHSKGYGLKQILNQAYVNSINSNEQKEMIKGIVAIAQDDII